MNHPAPAPARRGLRDLTPAQRAQLADQASRAYQAGASVQGIATRLSLKIKATETLIREAGTLLRPHGPQAFQTLNGQAVPVTPARRDQLRTVLAADYTTRAQSIATLAAAHGLGRTLTYNLLQEAGVTFRIRGVAPLQTLGGQAVPVTPEQRDQLRTTVADDYTTRYQSIRTIATAHGLSTVVVRNLLREAGVTPRPAGRPRSAHAQ